MSVKERIEEKLLAALAPTVLDVVNESGMHNVPKGSETHFKVVVVSPAFEGLSRVARHQLVYRALAEEMQAKPGVHALAIVSKTPAEWGDTPEVPASPPCLGGEARAARSGEAMDGADAGTAAARARR